MRENFVWIAMLFAVPLLLLQFMFGVRTTAEEQGIPLLTLLLMNEFGILLCAVAAGISISIMKKSGVRPVLLAGTLSVSVLALAFMWRLLLFYPVN